MIAKPIEEGKKRGLKRKRAHIAARPETAVRLPLLLLERFDRSEATAERPRLGTQENPQKSGKNRLSEPKRG
jgi:hypothetical protein